MTPDQIHSVIEFLWISGQITASRIEGTYTLKQNNQIERWGFPEAQPDLQAVFNSAQFNNYLSNRVNIIARKKAKELVDSDLKHLGEVLVDEFNLIRNWDMALKSAMAAATSLPDLKSRVAALPNLQPKTLELLKAAMDNK